MIFRRFSHYVIIDRRYRKIIQFFLRLRYTSAAATISLFFLKRSQVYAAFLKTTSFP